VSYTRYCLSHTMLLALDRVYRNGGAFVPGRSRGALTRRELIRPKKSDGTFATYNASEITASGVFALDQARQEGWRPNEIP
jgi:hypothetical protein